MEEILLANTFPKDTVTAIITIYKNMKAKIHSSDGDTKLFNIVAGVLQEDTLVPYLFIICLDYILRATVDLIKENGFMLGGKKKQEADYILQ